MAGIIKSQTKIAGSDRPMWAASSKSKETPATASHCSLVKKILTYFTPEKTSELDLDYNTGTAWLGQAKVGCVRSKPECTDHKIFQVISKPNQPWVDLTALAEAMQSDVEEVGMPRTSDPKDAILVMRDDSVHLASWNIGGAALELLDSSLQTIDTAAPAFELVCLQEVPRGSPGWRSEAAGRWHILAYQLEGDWRGTGLAHREKD